VIADASFVDGEAQAARGFARLSLELTAEDAPSTEKVIFDGVGRDAEDYPDLLDGAFQTVSEDQHRALPLGESLEALACQQRVFDVSVGDADFSLDGRTTCASLRGGRAQGRAYGDAIRPSFQRALASVVVCGLEDLEHTELDGVLGVVTVSQQRAAQTLNAAEQATDERALGLEVSPRNPDHQLYVVPVGQHGARNHGLRFATADPSCC
jgi:hypothetical protein